MTTTAVAASTVTPSASALAPHTAVSSDLSKFSLLDEVGRLARTVPDSQIAAWRAELSGTAPTPPRRQTLLHLRLGEWELAGQEDPKAALAHFRQVLALAPATDHLHGAALYEIAVTHYREGAYRTAADEFAALVHAPVTNGMKGYDRVAGALFQRCVQACVGYHAQRSAAGIPEPPQLDPNCGSAGLAVCLKHLGLPYDEKTVLASCRVTGLGSNAQDLLDACKKLGNGNWVAGRAVTADDRGLRALPLPAVAYVEHDHFIAVTKADGRGVTYVCSDCGCWPGGEVHLSWSQWRLLEPTLYVTIVRKGSAADKELASALDPVRRPELLAAAQRDGLGQVASAASLGTGALSGARILGQRMAQIAEHVTAALSTQPAANICGGNKYTLHCVPGREKCPMDHGGMGCGGGGYGASAGDPVNLATLEEEYTPPADDVIYNPRGPAVVWSRIYNSLRGTVEGVFPNTGDGSGATAADWSPDFGRGWSHGYNVYVAQGPTDANGTIHYALVMPNKSRISFTYSSTNGYALDPQEYGTPCCISWGNSLPVNSNSHTGFVVSWENGTRWFFDATAFQSVNGVPESYLAQISDIAGNVINLLYDTSSTPYRLSQIVDKNGSSPALLTIFRDPSTHEISSVTDCYGRSVNYGYRATPGADGDQSAPEVHAPELTQVSQLLYSGETDNPMRFQYRYTAYPSGLYSENISLLTSITRPHPNNSWDTVNYPYRTVTATISYDPNTLLVTGVTDGNGHQRVYQSFSTNPFQTQVTILHAANPAAGQPNPYPEFQYTALYCQTAGRPGSAAHLVKAGCYRYSFVSTPLYAV